MALPSNLLKEFASITNDQKSNEKNTSAYGVVVKDGDDAYVQLDGTEELTPVSLVMDAEDGDRVKIEVNRHTAAVTGNITSPASARTATNYIKLTEDGLIVGNLDKSGKPTGTYSLIAPGTYYIVAENKAILASFSADTITLGGGMAVFTTKKITLGNGMAVFSTEEITLGSGMATFTTESVSLNNGAGYFSSEEINLGEGKVVITENEISLGKNNEVSIISKPSPQVSLANGTAIFSTDQISLANGMTTITSTEVSIANGMAKIDGTSVKLGKDNLGNYKVVIGTNDISLGGGIAVFASDKITLGNGMAVITTEEISLVNGSAVFNANEVSLAGGMGVFTPEQITLAGGLAKFTSTDITLDNGSVVISSNQVSIANGMGIFTPEQITLDGGTAVIASGQISLANGAGVFSSEQISLMNGAAVINSSEISLANGAAYFSKETLKLGDSDSATIKLCGDKGSIRTTGDTLILQATNAVGMRTVNGHYTCDVVSIAGESGHKVSMQVSGDDYTRSVIVDMARGIDLNSGSGGVVRINGNEALHTNNLIADGTVRASGELPPNKKVKIRKAVSVPGGYHLTGIRQVTIDHSLKCSLVGFFTDPDTNTVGADVVNKSEDTIKPLNVVIEYFSLRSAVSTSIPDVEVEWGTESLE